MTDTALKAPPKRAGATQHQRRASFHTRRRSQHSIASFGEIGEDIIASPVLGSLLEKSEEIENSRGLWDAEDKKSDNPTFKQPGTEVKTKGRKHGRKQSNIHELFGENDEEEALQNVLSGLMEDESDGDRDNSDPEYSPRALHLEDASPSPRDEPYETYEETKPKQPPKNNRRNQSFGGIVDLFDEEELEGTQMTNSRIKELEEENEKLHKELQDSERDRQTLKKELEKLRTLIRSNTAVRELENVKLSKIALIVSTGTEIDRLRHIIDAAGL